MRKTMTMPAIRPALEGKRSDMRGIILLAAGILLTGCGRQEAEPDAVRGQDTTDSADANAATQGTAEFAANGITQPTDPEPSSVSPCLTQGTERLAVEPFRALGTEPFWSARVEGRCVTYSTPEDQQGTRVWTRYTPGPDGAGNWVGQLGGKAFELRVRAEAGCSDGMSDKRYPMAAELGVNGETRRGCAEPL